MGDNAGRGDEHQAGAPELLEAHDEVEADAQLQLVEADRAQVRRPQVVLLQAVRAVHEALEEDAVPESEHVAYFVQRHPTQPAEIRGSCLQVRSAESRQ